MDHKISRRQITKGLGLGVGAAALLTPNVSLANIVTPEQVEGPFYPVDPQADIDTDLTIIEGHTESALGEQVYVRGSVFDIHGQPIEGALVDIWQANHHGKYSHKEDPNTAPLDANFQGWGKNNTDEKGRYGFKTIKPGAYPLSFLGADGWRCRHIHFKVTCKGFKPLITQMYFSGDPLIKQDLEIAKVDKAYQHLLIAQAKPDVNSGLPVYAFDLMLASD